jgi:hypothetical protein
MEEKSQLATMSRLLLTVLQNNKKVGGSEPVSGNIESITDGKEVGNKCTPT